MSYFGDYSIEELRFLIDSTDQSLTLIQGLCEMMTTAELDEHEVESLQEQTREGFETVFEALIRIRELTHALLIHVDNNFTISIGENRVGTLWISSESSSSSSTSESSPDDYPPWISSMSSSPSSISDIDMSSIVSEWISSNSSSSSTSERSRSPLSPLIKEREVTRPNDDDEDDNYLHRLERVYRKISERLKNGMEDSDVSSDE